MSATAWATLEASGAPDVLVEYAVRRRTEHRARGQAPSPNAACELLKAIPISRRGWQAERARLADLARSHAWSFITWCFLEQILVPDLDLLLTRPR